jgi:hypothetical protein
MSTRTSTIRRMEFRPRRRPRARPRKPNPPNTPNPQPATRQPAARCQQPAASRQPPEANPIPNTQYPIPNTGYPISGAMQTFMSTAFEAYFLMSVKRLGQIQKRNNSTPSLCTNSPRSCLPKIVFRIDKKWQKPCGYR